MRYLLAATLITLAFNVRAVVPQARVSLEVQPSGVDVQIKAQDDRILDGTYYAESTSESPAILLLHQLYTSRSSWSPLIPPLLDAGFKVLAVDLRGYGKTGGKINWKAAQIDTVGWSNWLKEQSGVQSIAFMGSSMGSNLALVGCAAIENCIGAVAISPSLDYFGVKTSNAMQAGFPSLIIYADNDPYPKYDVPRMLELAGNHATTISYSGRAHGMALFDEHDDLISQIVQWLQNL